MNRKAIVIGASSEALHTMEKAKQYGIHITAFDGNARAEGLKCADKAVVVDISDEQKTIEEARKEAPDFVLTVPIGRYLTTIGAVNDALGIPGISREAAVLCTDKFAFHQRLDSMELRNCCCYRVTADGQILSQTQKMSPDDMELQTPFILKPRYGSGSRGIHLLENTMQMREALEDCRGEEYVLEECVKGEEYGVDGAVIGGEFQFVLLRRKENTPPPARQAVAYFSVHPSDPFYQEVQDYMNAVTSCMGLSECLLHADIIRRKDGPFVIELSARPSGHHLHDFFTPLCTEIDMAEQFIRYRLGQAYTFRPQKTRNMMIHYFDMTGIVNHVPDDAEASLAAEKADCKLIAYECRLQKGENLCPVSDGHSLMGRGFFVLESKKDSTLKEGAESVLCLFGMD